MATRRGSGGRAILAAIERIAAACEACSPWWSNTIRTARARTSGEYGGICLVMAPSFQDQEPPENPVRFTGPRVPGLARLTRHHLPPSFLLSARTAAATGSGWADAG